MEPGNVLQIIMIATGVFLLAVTEERYRNADAGGENADDARTGEKRAGRAKAKKEKAKKAETQKAEAKKEKAKKQK